MGLLDRWRRARDEAYRYFGAGYPRGLGYKLISRLRAHRSRLRREAPFASIAAYMLALSGLNPLRAFEQLSRLSSLSHVALEVNRLRRDAFLSMRHLSEVLSDEAKKWGGVWGQLLSSIVTAERTGLDPRVSLRDNVNQALNSLRADFRRLEAQFEGMIRTSTIIFGSAPMMIILIVSLFAPSMLLPVLIGLLTLLFTFALLWMGMIDSMVPRWTDYSSFYKRASTYWLPPALAVGAAVYFGLVQFPLTLVVSKAAAVVTAAVTFTVPFSLQWGLRSRVSRELLDDLPVVLRDIAEQVERGATIVQALEVSARVGSYRKYTARLLNLLAVQARVQGSLREGFKKVERLLPHPWRVAFDLLVLAQEAGGGSEAVHALSDAMNQYTAMIRSYKKSVGPYRNMSLLLPLATLGMATLIGVVLLPRIALAASGMQLTGFSLPLLALPTLEEVPVIRDWLYTAITLTGLLMALVVGKCADWTLGDAVVLASRVSVLLLIGMVASLYV